VLRSSNHSLFAQPDKSLHDLKKIGASNNYGGFYEEATFAGFLFATVRSTIRNTRRFRKACCPHDGFERDRLVAGIEEAVKFGAARAESEGEGLFGFLLLLRGGHGR
jgi:hypothetical protein